MPNTRKYTQPKLGPDKYRAAFEEAREKAQELVNLLNNKGPRYFQTMSGHDEAQAQFLAREIALAVRYATKEV